MKCQQQMDMVAHKRGGVDAAVVASRGNTEPVQIKPIARRGAEGLGAVVTPLNYVPGLTGQRRSPDITK